MFKVSVIIPVYNVERYIERVIESIIHQKYVGEVIVIDDGYPDKALEKCRELAKKYETLVILQHPDGENRGAGPSRNLGMKYATCPYIAFLDADDYCLDNRFEKTKITFNQHPEATVVYEPVGTAFENETAKQQFCAWRGINEDEAENWVTNMKGGYKGRDFLIQLLLGRKGSPCTDGITLKTSILKKITPWFRTDLRLHQDSEFWVRLAYYGCFYPGAETPIAMRWAHEENRISHRNYKTILKKETVLRNWAKTECEDPYIRQLIYKRYIFAQTRKIFKSSNILVLIMAKIRFIAFQIFSKR